MANFTDILSTQASTIEKPPVIPQGTYLGIVKGAPKIADEKTKRESDPDITFNIEVTAPQADVDLSSFPGNVQGTLMNKSFWASDQKGQYSLKRWLVEHLKIEEGTKTLGELIAEAPGRPIMMTVIHKPSKDGTEMFANIKDTAAT